MIDHHRWPPDWEPSHQDPTREARAVMNGMLIVGLLWVAICLAVAVWWNW